MPKATPRLSIVIPCYNEANRLPRTLRETLRFCDQRGGNYEIIVVSDGSKDNTTEVARAILASAAGNISSEVIEYTPNAGKGRAIKVGMTSANGERILFMDADYSVPLEDLVRAENLLDSGVDIAIGSRATESTQIVQGQSFLRERFAKLFGLIQRNYLGLKLKDTQCGFKLFTHSASQEIFTRTKLDSVIFDGEALWLARKMGFETREFPVEWTHDMDTRIAYTPMKAVGVLLDMLKIPMLHRGEQLKKVLQ
jgi:glycosyltransferase involved in cell wall biosynthesis